MNVYGLIGFPLGHSFSKGFFERKFSAENITDCKYENFPIDSIEKVKDVAATKGLRGFNITIPYKQQIFDYLAEVDPEAQEIGAVNCVKILPDGGMKGYNTDAYGFRRSLLSMIGSDRPEALVLGTGGASKAVEYVLRSIGIEYKMVSRTAGGDILSYAELTPQLIEQKKLIINTTPLGMYPKTDSCPELPYDALGSSHTLYDLVYNPAETEFLHRGRMRGAKVMNGAMMLIEQAERSWEIWNEK